MYVPPFGPYKVIACKCMPQIDYGKQQKGIRKYLNSRIGKECTMWSNYAHGARCV